MEDTPPVPEAAPDMQPVGEKQPAPKRETNYATLISFGVFLLGFCALFVSIRQASIMNRQTEILIQQAKASAWPILEIGLSRGFDSLGNITNYLLGVSNKGNGPAIIEAVKLSYKGRSAQKWGDLIELTGIPDSISITYTNDIISNRVLAPGGELLMLDLSFNPLLMRWVFSHADKLEIAICYRSIFDEHWTVTRRGIQSNIEKTVLKSVEFCPFDPADSFLE